LAIFSAILVIALFYAGEIDIRYLTAGAAVTALLAGPHARHAGEAGHRELV